MNRFLYVCSILVLLFFVVGSYLFPNDMIMWFASTAGIDNLIRGGLVAALLLLMVVPPPRSIVFRVLLGMVSVALMGWAVLTFYNEQLMVLDAIAYILFSVVFGLAALEITYDSDEPRTVAANPQPVLSAFAWHGYIANELWSARSAYHPLDMTATLGRAIITPVRKSYRQ